MASEWTELTMHGVVMDPTTGDPAVLLRDEAWKVLLAVPADPSVARALIAELEGIHGYTCATLLYRFLVRHRFSVRRVELSRGRSGDMAACLRYRHGDEEYGMEVRPADGLLVAAQTQAPVYAHHELAAVASNKAAPLLSRRDLLILSRRASCS